jgi:hypothetical protein
VVKSEFQTPKTSTPKKVSYLNVTKSELIDQALPVQRKKGKNCLSTDLAKLKTDLNMTPNIGTQRTTRNSLKAARADESEKNAVKEDSDFHKAESV